LKSTAPKASENLSTHVTPIVTGEINVCTTAFKNSGSTSGGKPTRRKKIFVSNQNYTPGLAHIDLQLSSTTNKEEELHWINVTALHDSGCAKTVIRTSTFERLLQQGHVELTNHEDPIVLVSCTGEEESTTGTADIMLHFQGDNGKKLSFELNVLIHPKITQDFLLGRDFTGSDAKAFETNTHLHLTDQYDVYFDPVKTSIANKSLCSVPLIASRPTPMHVAASAATTLPPMTYVEIYCTAFKEGTKTYQPIKTKGKQLFEMNNSLLPRVRSLPVVLEYHDVTKIPVWLYNDTHEDIFLEENTPVAEILLWRDQFECHHVQMKETTDQVYQCNKVALKSGKARMSRPEFIEEDTAMNEQEKEESFMNFLRLGYHHPSMTKVVEDKAALTELYKKSTVPIPDHLFESQFDVSHLDDRHQKLALMMFRENKDAFSRHACDLGKSKDIKMKIEIKDEEPHIQKYQPIPQAVQSQVRAILDQMLEYKIIRECNEPSLFCSNLLITKKKDGKSIRILLDGRLLNNSTIRKPMNLVTHQEIYAQLTGAKYVTTIDLSDAFFQIPLDEESQPLTAFYSQAHGKRYCFTRCPQGLRNSPLSLKLLMDKLFGDLANEVIHYADDIMIATNGTMADHFRTVAKVLERIRNGKIKIRPAKIHLARDTVDFLGVVWTKDTISIPAAKVLAFKNLPSPNTPKKAKSVICALAYYRRFIPNFAKLAMPIMELGTAHPKTFKWTETHEKSFRSLLHHICHNSTLHLPSPFKPYYVQTDASQYAGAGRVYQLDKDGNELLLACVSRTFTKAERAYSTFKKEVLALLYTLKSMDFFLRFADNLKILVDASSICHLRMAKDGSDILQRFSNELSRYNAEIHHVPGVNNEVSDVLSRHHTDIEKMHVDPTIVQPMTEKQSLAILNRLRIPGGTVITKEEVAWMLGTTSPPNPDPKSKTRKSSAKLGVRHIKNEPTTLPKRKINLPKESMHRPGVILPQKHDQWRKKPRKEVHVHSCQLADKNIHCNHTEAISYTDFKAVSKAVLTGVLTPVQFRQAQNADAFCQHVQAQMQRNKLKRFAMIDNLLFYRTKNSCKLVLPTALLDTLINSKHFSVFGLHFSRARILRDITARYHMPMSVLKNKLRILRNNCLICQFNTTGKVDQELKSSDYIHAPRVTWGVDIIPNMPMSEHGNRVALLAVDLFTGYIQLCPMTDRTSTSLIAAIDKTIVRPFGIPKFLRADEEPGLFSSKEFHKYLQPLGTKFLPTSVGSPWANGMAERSVRTIKEAARNFLTQEQVHSNWDLYVNFFTAAHNQSTSVYGFAPEELMFGYTKPNEHDLLQFWPQARDHSNYAEMIIPQAERNRTLANDRAIHKRAQNNTYKNQTRVKKNFQLGQIVAHRQLQLATGAAMGMQPKHTGPYTVESVDTATLSCIIEHMNTGQQIKAHFTNLSPVNFHPKANRLQANFDANIQASIPDQNQLADEMLTSQTTLHSVSVRPLSIPIDGHDEETIRARFVDATVIDDLTTVDLPPIPMDPDRLDGFGRIDHQETSLFPDPDVTMDHEPLPDFDNLPDVFTHEEAEPVEVEDMDLTDILQAEGGQQFPASDFEEHESEDEDPEAATEASLVPQVGSDELDSQDSLATSGFVQNEPSSSWHTEVEDEGETSSFEGYGMPKRGRPKKKKP